MPVTDTSLTAGSTVAGDEAAAGNVRTDRGAQNDSTVRYRAAVICASDRCFQGVRKDESIPIIAEILSGQGYEITASAVLPDEYEALRAAMMSIADENSADLIITTGGTGLAPRDITPEAMRAESMKITPHGMLSRGIAGIRKRTLIINLPGSPKAARENLACVLPALDHALLVLTGGTQDCAAAEANISKKRL